MSADELRDELNRLREIVREQGETIGDQNERIDELEGKDDENNENAEKEAQDLIEVRTDDEKEDLTLRDVWIAGLPFGRILDQIETKIDGPGRIKDRLADLESGSVQNGETADTTGADDQEERASPLAQLIDLPVKKAEEVLTENQARARLVAQRARELGTDTKAGLVVKSADIKEHLLKREESAHSETISRVMASVTARSKRPLSMLGLVGLPIPLSVPLVAFDMGRLLPREPASARWNARASHSSQNRMPRGTRLLYPLLNLIMA